MNKETKMDGTVSTSTQGPVTLADILAAVERLKALPKRDQWILVSPQGDMYSGTAQQMLPVLLRDHPFFKMPLSLGPF